MTGGDELNAMWSSLPLVLILTAPALADAVPLTAGDHTVSLNHDGRERSAIVHVPQRAAERPPPLSVVLNFHGGGGHGAQQKEYSLLDALAERENFLTVYPNGTGRLSGRLLTWNAGTCCAYSVINKIDDVGFVRALIDKLGEIFPIDRRRIYATGMSNGGMMAHRLAAEADVIAAAAPVAGGMVLPLVKSPRAVPVLHIHSSDDPRALYAGGLGPRFPLTNNRVFHANVEEIIKRWADHNGCAIDPIVADRRVDRSSRGHSAIKYVYPNCRDGAAVALWKLTGAGHVWPGGKQKVFERILGPSTDIIDANREMWEFFKGHAL